MAESIIRNKSFLFALDVIFFYKQLVKEKEYVLSKQLLRSGTSIGANISESQSAQSRKDFLHKIEIALKEARETEFWLLLLHASQLVKINCTELMQKTTELIKLLAATAKTLKGKKTIL